MSKSVDWNQFKSFIKSKNEDGYIKIVRTILDTSIPFLLIEPIAPIIDTCIPPPIQADCSKFPKTFQKRRNTPVKLAHFIQLGFDVDSLEIQLNELFGVADKLFIIESTIAQYKFSQKPLIWELLSRTPRFKKFINFVVHFVIDDAEGHGTIDKAGGIWVCTFT